MTPLSDAGASDPPSDLPPVMAQDPVASPAAASASPRRLRAFLVGVVLAVALALFLFVGLGTSTKSSGKGTGGVVPVGATAPNFTLPSVVASLPVTLDALGKKRHHPVILNFFASYCVPCQLETPLLASTAAAEQAKGSVLQFVGVDAADSANGSSFVRQSGITYPVGADNELRVTASVYGLNAEPQTFFIDESGVVIGHHYGALTKSELDRWIHMMVGSH